jgi:hypothetical protein
MHHLKTESQHTRHQLEEQLRKNESTSELLQLTTSKLEERTELNQSIAGESQDLKQKASMALGQLRNELNLSVAESTAEKAQIIAKFHDELNDQKRLCDRLELNLQSKEEGRLRGESHLQQVCIVMLLSSYVFAVKHVRDCLSRCSCNLI